MTVQRLSLHVQLDSRQPQSGALDFRVRKALPMGPAEGQLQAGELALPEGIKPFSYLVDLFCAHSSKWSL